MKRILKYTICALILGSSLTACDNATQPQPATNDNAILQLKAKVEEGDQIPADLALAPVSNDLVDESGSVIGTLDVTEDANYVYLRNALVHGWQIKKLRIFIGNRQDIPIVNGGTMDVDEFPLKFDHSTPQMICTVSINRGSVTGCNDISVYFQAVQLNFFGTEIAQPEGWADGISILNGYYFNHCLSVAGSHLGRGRKLAVKIRRVPRRWRP